jgi:hypothetical protein
MSTVPTEPASLPGRPAEDGDTDVLGAATAPSGGDGTFEGDLDDDTFDVVLKDLKTKRTPNPFKGGEMRDQLVWLFAIVGQEDKGELAFYTSFSLHEKSHLPKVIAALGAPTLNEGDPIKKSAYLGKTCRADIEMVKSKKSDKHFPRITKLKPAKAAKGKKKD